MEELECFNVARTYDDLIGTGGFKWQERMMILIGEPICPASAWSQLNKEDPPNTLLASDFQSAISENCAAIYRLRETSNLPTCGGGITLHLIQS